MKNIDTNFKKIMSFDWRQWVKRPTLAFMLSLINASGSKKAFKKIGLSDWEYISYIFSDGSFYWSDQVFNLSKSSVSTWLRSHSVEEINNQLDKFYSLNKEKVKELSETPNIDTLKKFKEFVDIEREVSTYIWVSHLIEAYISPMIRAKTERYVKKDIDKFISEASYPVRKNALEIMEEKMRQGDAMAHIVKEFSWMRCRDGFSRGYSYKELSEHKKSLKKYSSHKYPNIPKPLSKLFKDARELVYLRTKRTDVWYEFAFIARPLIKAVAYIYKLPFPQLKYYSTSDLLIGRLVKYPKNFSCASYKDKFYFFKYPIISDGLVKDVKEIRGTVARAGKIRGRVKIIMTIKDFNKMENGDILVTFMTSPNFLPIMKKASAFITDEGGLTCHAAIIAREMKKPCLIGTKVASKILKDNDLVELDTSKGLVRIIS